MTEMVKAGARLARRLRRDRVAQPGSRSAMHRCLASLLVMLAACGGREAADVDTSSTATGADSANVPAASVGSGTAACPTSAIESNGVGVVRLGAGIGEIGACPTRDTTWSLEGMQERGRIVTIGNGRVLAVTGSDTVVSRVIIADPAWRTAAGAGVGSTVAELERAYGDYCAFPAEIGGIVAIFPNFTGVSFVTDAMLPPSGPVEALALPRDARVTQVLVHGSTVRCVPSRRA